MKYIFLILFFLIGCSNSHPCIDEKEHKFGKWENSWEKPNDFNFIGQARYCEKCNWREKR